MTTTQFEIAPATHDSGVFIEKEWTRQVERDKKPAFVIALVPVTFVRSRSYEKKVRSSRWLEVV